MRQRIRRSFRGSIILALIACGTQLARAAPPQTAPTTQPDPVEHLLSALHDADFKEVFKACKVYQFQIDSIHAANPQVLWPKMDAEYFDAEHALYRVRNTPSAANATFAFQHYRAPTDVFDLAQYVAGNESHTVQEKRLEHPEAADLTANFVSIKYGDEIAPWVDGKLLKETILKVMTEPSSNLYLSVSRIKEADVFRDDIPLRICGISEKQQPTGADVGRGDPIRTSLNIHVMGGKPPYRAVLRAPGYESSITKDTAGEKTVAHDLGQMTDPKYERDGFLDQCMVSVTDADGNIDVARFSTHSIHVGAFDTHFYTRQTWFRMGPRYGAPYPFDWQNVTLLTTNDPQSIVKHFDELDALKKLELASKKRTAGNGFVMYQFIAYPGLWSDAIRIPTTNQFTRWHFSQTVMVRTGDTDYPKGKMPPMNRGTYITFKPAGNEITAITLKLFQRAATAEEKAETLPVLPEPPADNPK